MIHGKKVIVVLPAYKAAQTVKVTYDSIPMDVVDDVILVDDASDDDTASIARELGIKTHVHPVNRGYGGNQKTCYAQALAEGADIVVMLHPDYQYDPRLVTAMSAMIASGIYDCVLGSRILGNTSRKGGMPLYKYIANRFLTAFQNLMMGTKLSEFHTGYRAFSSKVLQALPLEANSDDFVFDNQMLAQVAWHRMPMGEISCPTKYFPEASSINFKRSCIYGLGVLKTSAHFRLARLGLAPKVHFENPDGLLQIPQTD
ncbi:MAG: glycosyltransferase family 2 protein [Phycisphaeraceae bacterium JB051]